MKINSILIVIIWFVFINVPIYSQVDLPDIEITKLTSNLYKFHHGVNNWLVLIGLDGTLLSDSAPEIYAEAMKSKLKDAGHLGSELP